MTCFTSDPVPRRWGARMLPSPTSPLRTHRLRRVPDCPVPERFPTPAPTRHRGELRAVYRIPRRAVVRRVSSGDAAATSLPAGAATAGGHATSLFPKRRSHLPHRYEPPLSPGRRHSLSSGAAALVAPHPARPLSWLVKRRSRLHPVTNPTRRGFSAAGLARTQLCTQRVTSRIPSG